MLIPTYYLLSKIWDIFATRRRILLKINKNYFRTGEVISSYIQIMIACSSGELHAISLFLKFFKQFFVNPTYYLYICNKIIIVLCRTINNQ